MLTIETGTTIQNNEVILQTQHSNTIELLKILTTISNAPYPFHRQKI
jgi:hypothetical protein